MKNTKFISMHLNRSMPLPEMISHVSVALKDWLSFQQPPVDLAESDRLFLAGMEATHDNLSLRYKLVRKAGPRVFKDPYKDVKLTSFRVLKIQRKYPKRSGKTSKNTIKPDETGENTGELNEKGGETM